MHTNIASDIVALDAQAVRASVDLVAQITVQDLARPTPCADWTLHALLKEFKQGLMFPARQAISFHFVDYVVHSWDVARTLDLPVHLDPALLDTALSVAEAVPGGDARLAPGAAFAPAVTWPDGSRLDQIVAILGRSPNWERTRA